MTHDEFSVWQKAYTAALGGAMDRAYDELHPSLGVEGRSKSAVAEAEAMADAVLTAWRARREGVVGSESCENDLRRIANAVEWIGDLLDGCITISAECTHFDPTGSACWPGDRTGYDR